MAEITLTLTDTPSGGVSIASSFRPAIGHPRSPAQSTALSILAQTRKECGLPPLSDQHKPLPPLPPAAQADGARGEARVDQKLASLRPDLVIGLVGAAGSGKSTVAELLSDSIPAGTAVLSFAQPIRMMLYSLMVHAWIEEPSLYIHDRALKEQPIAELADKSYRELAQSLGTEWGQQCNGRDFWIRLLAQRMGRMLARGVHRFVISDCRFQPEVDFVRSLGGEIWRIDRPGVAPVRDHVSEHGARQIEVDRVIDNSGTLEVLRVNVLMNLALTGKVRLPAETKQ